jgi:hypothetical protein
MIRSPFFRPEYREFLLVYQVNLNRNLNRMMLCGERADESEAL